MSGERRHKRGKRRQYQSFPDATGASDSAGKLESLRLPERLDGKAVLDIACNEGFFCQEAWRRGASRVVGIDKQPLALGAARKRDDRTDYRLMDWSQLSELDESFDVVLLLSALHYAEHPRRLLRDALGRLTADGTLILECGIAPGREPEWRLVERPSGEVRHPTASMLRQTFSGCVIRRLGPSVAQSGDPVPRFVFRIKRRAPTVMLIAGGGGSGKSTLAKHLKSKSVRVIRLDPLIKHMRRWSSDEELTKLCEEEIANAGGKLGPVGRRLAREGLEARFADAVIESKGLASTPHAVTIVEGHALDCGEMARAFGERLAERGAYVFNTEPSPFSPGADGEPGGASSGNGADPVLDCAPNRPARRR
jgi:SAM-dependent methyltransferase